MQKFKLKFYLFHINCKMSDNLEEDYFLKYK